MIDKARLGRGLMIAGVGVTAVLLVATLLFVYAESTWVHASAADPEHSFLYATTGTEIMPLPVFQVLPYLFPDQFQPGGAAAGDWIQQYGLIPGKQGVNEGLPQGFFISNHRPKSGAPSPVQFVGINCSFCHTSLIKRTDNDPGVMVRGMGNTSLDFIAWVDGFKTAVLDEKRMTPKAIFDTYEQKFGRRCSCRNASPVPRRAWGRTCSHQFAVPAIRRMCLILLAHSGGTCPSMGVPP